MISIGGHLIYILYLVFAGILVFFSTSHLYHAIRFGHRDPLMITTTGIFIAGVIAIVIISLSLLSHVNWSSGINASLPNVSPNLPNINELHF